MYKRRTTMLGGVLGVMLLGQTMAHANLTIGIDAPRGLSETQARWAELGNYLTAELGQPVTIMPLHVVNVVAEAKIKQLNFVLGNPVQTLSLQDGAKATPLVSLNGKSGPYYAGTIVARKGNGITRARDLKGKTGMSLRKGSAASYMFNVYHLRQQGVDVFKDMDYKQADKQDDLVMMVQRGQLDVAMIRTGILESMEKEGRIKIDEFVVVDQRQDENFSQLHSTPLYPEWYMSAMPNVDPEVVKKVKTALLKLNPSMPAARTAEIKGFVEALPLHNMKTIINSFNNNN